MLPNDFDIFRDLILNDQSIINKDVRKATTALISAFQRIIMNNRIRIESAGHLPPLKLRSLEDESVLIEWIFADFRIGFAIEPVEKESSWYLVSNKKLNEVSASGLLLISVLKVINGPAYS